MFRNKINGKVYIGRSVNEKLRYYKHISNSKSNLPIDRAIRKYGKDNFEYEVLLHFYHSDHKLLNDILNMNEIAIIKAYNSTDPNIGYNITEGGGGISGYSHTDETKEKIRESCKKNMIDQDVRKLYSDRMNDKKIKVEQQDISGNVINSFESISEASRKTGIKKGNISNCITGKRKTSGGYRWIRINNND